MAQFVTHIQPTLVEASHHHLPHHHKDHSKDHHSKDFHGKDHKDHHGKDHKGHHGKDHDSKDHHSKDGKDHHSKEPYGKDHHVKDHHHHYDCSMDLYYQSHAREFPVLPHLTHTEHSHDSHDSHYESGNKRDSGQYIDSHGVPHTFQMHFVDSQGIYRDCHGHGINIDRKKDYKEKEEKSPYKSIEDFVKPIPPQFIDLHGGVDNKNTDGNTSFLRAARNGQLDKVLEHLKSNIDINTSNANGLNALHLASKDGHVEIVEELLKRGAVVDAATKKGNTALHIASLAGQEEVVKLLVSHGASVNVQSQNGFTPLYMAAQENHDNVVKYLLANGANQSLSTEDGFTPLAVAMQQGHDKVVTVLLENDTRGKVRLPALHIAAKKDDVKAAKLLLENEHNPDVTSKSGFTPLHIASHYGNQSIANLLVQKGADVNYSAKHNITPLHVAAKWGKTNMVTVLLEKGANIESKTRDGLTPLHCAARSGHEQVVDMLLERGAPISSKTKNGLAPLHMAAQGDHVDAARILLYHRAPVDEVTVDYLTALHVAAHCGHVRVAKLLLDRQADANARALNGFTPLHIACKKNRIKVVELLLKHGASIGATTESGLTPLHVASFMGCMNIVIYLLQHDANPDVPTVRGETPLHLAARANQTDIIRILLRNEAQVDARAREQQTPLHIASRLGNVDIVMLLLQHGAKVDNTTKDMYTALHIASKEGQDEVAAALIDNGASLNATTKKGFTPLHLAAKYGHLKVAKLLLQKEAPVDAQGKNGVTPLHVASHYDHQNVALLLLEKGASPYATAKNGHTPLHIAAKKNQMDIANTLLEYGAKPNAESKAGFTPLHLSAQEGHSEMSDLLIEHKADTNYKAKNGLTPLHLCAQEDKVPVAEILVKSGAEVDSPTKNGYTPLHIASHYGQINMVRFLLANGADVKATTSLGYTPLHQAAQQGHTNIVTLLLENGAQPNTLTSTGQTPLQIAQKLGYITVIDTLKVVTDAKTPTNIANDEKYRVVAPEAMHETFMSDSEEEGEDTVLGDQTYRYLTADEMKSLGDDSLPIDVTRDERIDSNKMASSTENILPTRHIEDNISPEHIQQNYIEYIKKFTPDNVDIDKHPIHIGKLHWKNFLVSFLVDARGGAMRGCRHSGVRVIVPPRCAPSPTRITCRYVRPQRTPHPPPLMEGEALASRVLELGPVGAKFLGPVIIEVPHFAALRGKEREIVILRSDNGDSWKEHTVEATEEVLNEVLHDSFEAEDLNQMEDVASGRITRIVTQDFPQYFAVVSRIRQEVHAIGPEGGMVSSTVVPQVQAVFPQGALTKKIKVGLQAQPIDPELTAKLLGHGVAVSPVVTVEPRRRKFHKAITLSMPAPRAHSQGMINQYSGNAPTLRLLCSITGGTTRAQWEDVTGSTPLTFVNDCVSFTTTVSARFWLMDCRNVGDATKMATELYREAIYVPFMAKFVVFAKRVDPLEARLRVFCMTDDKEDKTLEHQEHFTEVAKSRDVEVLEGKPQFIEFAGNLVPITKSGEQLEFSFRAFRENRLPFSVRVKDQHAEAVSRCLFMRESKLPKGEPPQQPICILNIVLPDDIVVDTISLTDTDSVRKLQMFNNENFDYYRPDPRLSDMSNLLGDDWVQLATQLGLTTSEINVIKSEYPDSVAKQAQSMLRMWLSQSGNKAQANTLESALRRIGREDIIPQCLNVDYPGHGIHKEIGKQRLKTNISLEENSFEKEIIKDVESTATAATTTTTTTTTTTKQKADKIDADDNDSSKFDKYSAEEKAVVQETSDEEDFNKTVTERRHQIEERLSVDRTVPASSQRVEIVQEITSIKRQSLVENKIAEVEQKVSVDFVDDVVKTTTTTTKPPTTSTTTSTTVSTPTATKIAIVEDQETKSKLEMRRDSELLEGVTQRFEADKKHLTKIMSTEDPKSPKLSKTPPPSPADFINKEQTASIQEWDVPKKSSPTEKPSSVTQDAGEQGLSTTTERLVASNEEKLLDKPLGQQPLTGLSDIDNNLVIDLVTSVNQTNAFIQSESQPEPYDALAEKYSNKQSTSIDRKNDDNKNNINEKKKAKKGFFGSIKTFVKESFESDSDSEKSPKKTKKQKKEKKCKVKEQDLSGSSMQKPKLPTPPLEPHDLEDIPFVEASLSDLPPPYKPPPVPLSKETVPVTDLDFGIENKLNMTEKQETLSLPKKKIKSKTVHIEEVTKTIEPFVLEAEEFSVVVDPTKQESPKKSKETFTINIDESIEKIEKEILEKSPILSAEKIRKPLADLDLSGDIPTLKPRIDAENKDDVQAVVSQPPDNVVNMPEKFERQDRRVSYKEELEEIGTNVQEEIEIIEKQDRELSKEKKGAFFGLFKKRDSRDEKKIVLSQKTLQEINETQGFLKNEICNYNDIKPVISKEDKNEQELEDKNVRDSDEATKNQSGSFFGLFKKTKKEEEEVNKNEKSKETIVAQEEIKENEEETKQSSSGLFGIFKKSKKDETELTQVVLSKQVLKDMDSSKKFLQDEVANYEDVKLTAEVKETKVFKTEEDNENKIDVKVADKIQEPDEETSGFFGFFKKSKKEDKPKMQAEKLGADTVEELKQVEVCFEVETKVDKKEEQPSKEFQVTELKDEKVKIEEKSKLEKKLKSISRESSPKPSGFFGLFKKPQKDESSDANEKSIIPEAALRDISDTNKFIMSEITNYNDVKPIKFDIIAEPKDETIDLTTKPTNLKNIEKIPSETTAITKKTVNPLVEEIKENVSTEEVVRRSPKSSRGLFNIFRKSKDGCLEISEEVLKNINETRQFLISEKENYDDVKPPKFEAIIYEETNNAKIIDSAQESSPKPTKGFLSSIFKKSKDDSQDIQQTESIENEKKTDVSKEIVNEKNLKAVTEISVEKQSSTDASPKTSRGLFSRLKKSKDESIEGSILKTSNKAVLTIKESDEFLKNEIINYQDVKPKKFETVIETTIEPTKSTLEGTPKHSKKLFGFLKKSKDDSVESKIVLSETALKDMACTSDFLEKELQYFDDMKPAKFATISDEKQEKVKNEAKEIESSEKLSKSIFKLFKKSKTSEDEEVNSKPLLSETVLKEMHDSNEFLNTEKEKYYDVMPKIIVTEHQQPKESTGFLSRFKKSKKEEDIVVLVDVSQNEEEKIAEKVEASLEEEPKTGFLAKFKITKKRPTSQEDQVSEETLKNMVDAGEFLNNEKDNYEDVLMETKEIKIINEASPLAVEKLPKANEIPVKTSDVLETVETVTTLIENTKSFVVIEEETDKIKDNFDQNNKKSKKEKKGIFNIFGKKSKSQEASESKKEDSDTLKQRKSSSPFKFFEKSKNSEDDSVIEKVLIEKTEQQTSEMEIKDDILTIELNEQLSLTDEVLASLDKKISNIRQNYSKESVKHMHDCRDFLFIEMDNYDNGKDLVVTDIDKDSEDLSKEAASKAIDDIISLATTTIVMQQSEELQKSESKQEITKTDLTSTEEQVVKDGQEKFTKNESPKPKKQGFLSKLGNFITGTTEDISSEAKKNRQIAEEKLSNVDINVSTKILETSEFPKDKSNILTENLKTIKDSMVDNTQQTFESTNKDIGEIKTSIKQETDSFKLKQKDCANTVKAKVITTIDDVNKTSEQVADNIAKAQESVVFQTTKLVDTAIDNANESIKREAENEFNKLPSSAKHVTDEIKFLIAENSINFEDKILTTTTKIKEDTCKSIETCKESSDSKIEQVELKTKSFVQDKCNTLESIKKQYEDQIEKTRANIEENTLKVISDAAIIKKELIDGSEAKLNELKQSSGEKINNLKETKETLTKQVTKEINETKISINEKVEDDITKVKKVLADDGKEIKNKIVTETSKKTEDIKEKTQKMQESLKQNISNQIEDSEKSLKETIDNLCPIKDLIDQNITSQTSHIQHIIKSENDHTKTIKNNLEEDPTHQLQDNQSLVNQSTESVSQYVTEDLNSPQNLSETADFTTQVIDGKINNNLKYKEQKLEQLESAKESLVQEINHEKQQKHKILEQAYDNIQQTTKSIETKVDKAQKQQENVFEKVTSNVKEVKNLVSGTVTSGNKLKRETLEESINKTDKSVNVASSKLQNFQNSTETKIQEKIYDTDKQLDCAANMAVSIVENMEQNVSENIDKIQSNTQKELKEAYDSTSTIVNEQTVKLQQIDEELTKLTMSMGPIVGEQSKKRKQETKEATGIITSPTSRVASQKYSTENRPSVVEITRMKSEDEDDKVVNLHYTVTEPDDENDSKRKPLFHLESEDDDSFETSFKPRERSDSVKSNVLETLSENKLDHVLSKLEEDVVKNLQQTVTGTKEETIEVEGEAVKKAEETLETLKKDSQADVDQIEQKLRDLDKALETLEHASDPKLERKLHRVERKFERMASEVIDSNIDVDASPTEVETRGEHEFQRLVSQLSTEEVSDFQKEYSHLWDETTFSKSDEWDSKTPDSQVDVQELPQEIATSTPTLTEDTKQIPQPKPRFAKDPPLQLNKSQDEQQPPKQDKQISPVRDDLLDDDEVVLETYSDKKKFWENVTSKESIAPKRLSLSEISVAKNELIKKRMSVHEIGVFPKPKPRTVQVSQSIDESNLQSEIVKELTQELSKIKAETILPSLSQKGEDEEEETDHRIMTEYQASFLPPSEMKRKSPPKVESDKESSDSESDNQLISGGNENTGYISDSGDVEHYISDSEIEDRVPQIRERQMSVFAPPVAAVRKNIYERSSSLPTEDLYEVSARSAKLRKQYYEEQIKKEMIEEQLTSEIEEEPSPERKTIFGTLIEQSSEDKTTSSVQDLVHAFDKNIRHSIDEVHDIENFMEIIEKKEVSFDPLHKPVLKTKDESQGSISSTQIIETHKEIDFETQTNRFSVGSEHSSSSKETKDESISKPDSMEVHVDKSEIEDSEKLAELDQDGTDMETKSIDSFNATEMSPKSSFLVDEPIPEITVTLSGKQRRISEESDEYAPKIDKTDKPDIESPIRVPEEHVEDTVWEVSVQSQPEARFNEKAISFDSVTVEKIDEDLSISTKDESDLGSEIHQDHSDSNASDKIKSESHSDIERIILDSLHHQKVDPVEAKAIASALIGEIETEIERRECLPPASETYDISEYLKYLAETKGLDEREVELVESVLARRQRELSKLSRGDTQASSIEITDEDLRYSGTDFEASHILEQQISQLKAEKIDEMKTLSFLDKIDEKLVEETHTSKDYKSYDNGVASAHKTEMRTKTSEGIKSEKSETKDTIFEEDETISESTTHEFEQKDSQIEATATEVIESYTHNAIIKEVHQGTVDIKKEEIVDSSTKSTTIENDDKTVAKEEFKTEENRKIEANIKHEFELTETRDDYQVNLKGELRTDDFLKEEKLSKLEKCKETKDLKDGGKFEKESAIEESINKVIYSEIVGKKIEETQALKDEDCRITQSQTHSTTILMDVQRQSATSKETTETLETVELDPALADTLGEIKTIVTHQEIKRTSSSDSKSSADSGKTPDDQFSTCSSGRKGDSETSKQIEKPEVQLRKNLGLHKPDRKSGIEFEAYSSSGESHYHSFELDSGKSRPCSSDIEGIVAAGSSEYESALTSQDYSSRSHLTSTEYHTAVSSLSSKESMKSLDSESSGHLGSIEISELSETLVPSASDLEGDDLDGAEQQLLDEESWTSDQVDDDLNDIQSKMKRSHEMTFQPEPKILTESPQGEDVDKKLFTSMDETSVVSMSLSSTSATEPQTVIELSRTDSEKGGSMTVSGTSGQLSIEGSCDSLVFHPTITASTTDISTSTGNTDANLQIESITFTTSVVDESGIRSVSTQVTSETNASEIEKVEESITSNGTSYVEMKKKGHRRQESTSFVPPILTGIKAEIEPKIHSDLAESDKYTAELSLKEVISDEKKDVDEKEKDESCETEADQGFQQDVREGKYKDDQEDEIKDDTPEFSSETQTSIGELEQEYKSALARSQETKKKIESASELHFQKEPLEKKDSHGKSSSTSSEKSSFEEAEAEAAFNMVAHISPAHKIKQICPILEDEDAEKHELETRERAQKEFEKKRAQMRDQSPGSIPDIKVTEHMTPLIDQGFHYPEVDIAEHERKQEEAQKSVPQTPSSKSSEDTDQGREYVLEDSGISIPEESGTESKSTVVEQAIKEDLDKDTESPNSDSFEMLEKPDLIDDFVVIEEVAKEAHECDSEGKSVSIHSQKVVKKKKHDEEVEAYLAHSAPTPLTKMTDVKFYPDGSSSDELGFEFEDSPPINNAGTATSYDQELEANKKWIEQQFQGDQAARMAAGYDYEMDFERGPLEDIKEEDINDFDGSSRIGSLGSQKESGGSLGGSIKDSYSSTPEYDVLAGRKYFTRSGDHDDVSMSSLQEFESLERAMSLEQRKFHQGSQDSSSNGSFKTRYNASKSGQGDDVSVSSLKEFEGLEMACIAAHKVEIKVKEEEAILAQIEEGQESLASESESLETISRTDKKTVPESDEEDYEKRMFEIDEIIRQAQTNVERFIDLKEGEKTESLGRGDSIEEVSRVPDLELDAPVVRSTVKVQWKENDAMITSTDSIEAKVIKSGSQHDSTDSLDQKTGADIMTASTDSIEVQSKKTEPINLLSDSIEIKDEGACGMISSDSLELAVHQKPPDEMIESTDSLMDVTSSTATHATYQYETDSVFSGSFTSGGSNTMVSSTDTIEPHHVDIGAAARKVWCDEEAGTSGFSTEYMQDTGKPYVTEVIEPCEGDEFSHTIHRRVEMPPEVRKITFYGSDADVRLKQFIDDFNEGEHVEEIEEVDEAGNIHTKRVVQKRVVIKCSDDNEATTGEKDQLLKKSLASKTNQLITKEAKAEDAGAASSSAGGIESSSIKVEKDEQKFDMVGQPSTHQGSISDQHQLSDEMKELLKELEKESKQ